MFSIGQLIRVNPELIPETAKDDELLGELGVPGLFRHGIFEITKLDRDSVRGDIAFCKLTNPEVFKTVIPGVKDVKYEGELVLLQKEIVLANTMITLDYTIKESVPREVLISNLFREREAMKSRGLDKRHKQMRDNWKEIQILRGEVEGPMPSLKSIVMLPKHKREFPNGIEIEGNQIPKQGDEESVTRFKRFLTGKIRSARSQSKMIQTDTVAVGSIGVQKIGGVFLSNNSLLKAYEEMMKTTLETDKKPIDSKATYVGIEVEFIYSGKYDILKKLLIENKLHKYVCLKDDGSLRSCHNAGYKGKELTILCKTTEVESVLKKLDNVFMHPEIDGYANRSCGLHVHLDMRKRDVNLAFKNLVRVQNILRGAQPSGRVGNTHCKANTNDNFRQSVDESGGNRYWVVNPLSFSKHSSIEVRIHEGTTDGESIYSWVTFLNAIADHTKEIPKNEIKFAEDLVAKYDIDIPLHAIDYVDRRIEKFNSLSIAN